MTKKSVFSRLVVVSLAVLFLANCGGGGGDGGDGTAEPATITKEATLTLGQEVPVPTPPPAVITGTMTVTLTTATNAISGTMTLSDATRVTAAHIHDGEVGVAGGVVIALSANGNVFSIPAGQILTAAQAARFKAGSYYVNVHTNENPVGGEIRGQLLGFAGNIQPIFSASCALGGCHVPGSTAPMSLRSGESVTNLVNQPALVGTRVIPFDSTNSTLYKRISGTSAGAQMPASSPPLVANEQNLIKVWIDMGAKDN